MNTFKDILPPEMDPMHPGFLDSRELSFDKTSNSDEFSETLLDGF